MEQKMQSTNSPWQPEPAEASESIVMQGGEELSELLDSGSSETAAAKSPERHTLSVIGETLVFKGDLTVEEDLLIQGHVSGTIQQRARNLTIGASGDVQADIVAQRVIIQGKVRGDLRASESIIVEASARVEGNLYAPSIGLKEGAKFKGSIDMDPGCWEHKPKQRSGQPATSPEKATTASASSQTSSRKKSSDKSTGKASSGAKGKGRSTELSDDKVDTMLD